MIEMRIAKLKRALGDSNLSSAKRAVLQSGLNFLTTVSVTSYIPVVGSLVSDLFPTVPQ